MRIHGLIALVLGASACGGSGGNSGSCETDANQWDLLACPATFMLRPSFPIEIYIDIEDPCEGENSFDTTVTFVSPGITAILDNKIGRQHRTLSVTCLTEGSNTIMLHSSKPGVWDRDTTVAVDCVAGAPSPDLSPCEEPMPP